MQALSLFLDASEESAAVFDVVHAAVQKRFNAGSDDGEGRFELVRDIRDKVRP